MADNAQLERVLDELILLISTAELKKKESGMSYPLSYFDELEPLTHDFVEATPNTGRLFLNPNDITLRDLEGRLDIGIAGNIVEDKNETKVCSDVFALHRVKRVNPKELRGKGYRYCPVTVEHAMGIVEKNTGQYLVNKHYYGLQGSEVIELKSNAWDPTLETFISRRKTDVLDEARRAVKMAMSIQFTRRYEWRVVLGYVGYPSVSFITDPTGAQEVFRLRDIPEGKSRRAALRNWVKEHWRQKRDGGEAKVREHLRGVSIFTWNGLRCVIKPSDFDLEKEARLKSEKGKK